MSLYTAEVRKIFKEYRAPFRGFIVDMVEHPEYLGLRVYRDNVESFSDSQKVLLAEYLFKLQDAIRSTGVKCHIEGSENAPPNLLN
jgi:hypothetical protein